VRVVGISDQIWRTTLKNTPTKKKIYRVPTTGESCFGKARLLATDVLKWEAFADDSASRIAAQDLIRR